MKKKSAFVLFYGHKCFNCDCATIREVSSSTQTSAFTGFKYINTYFLIVELNKTSEIHCFSCFCTALK